MTIKKLEQISALKQRDGSTHCIAICLKFLLVCSYQQTSSDSSVIIFVTIVVNSGINSTVELSPVRAQRVNCPHTLIYKEKVLKSLYMPIKNITNVQLMWVSSHQGISGNEAADQLAGNVTTLSIYTQYYTLLMTLSQKPDKYLNKHIFLARW